MNSAVSSSLPELLDEFIDDSDFEDYFGDEADVRRAVEYELEKLRQRLEEVAENARGDE